MNEFPWTAHPALRCAIALAGGIAVADRIAAPLAIGALGAATLVLAAVLRRRPPFSGAAALAVVMLGGVVLAHAARQRVAPLSDAIAIGDVDCVARVVERPKLRGGRLELVVASDSLTRRGRSAIVRRQLLVRVGDTSDPGPRELRAGDRVSILGTLASPSRALVPGGFDERVALASRGITLTLDARRSGAIHGIASGPFDPLAAIVEGARDRMGGFAETHVGGEEAEVVRALLTGERHGVERSTRDAFVATGTLHVLAVSGLHVAIIALALSVATSWLPSRWAQLVLFVVVLGLYALVAGAGASIVRAWCMAACFMLARVVGRRTHPLNVLAVAAILILVARPADLYDIGFQLSFAAVGGIVLFYARALEAIALRWPGLRERVALTWLVRSLALTMSAQVLTAPLLMVHFGSVPALGLLLNLPVVPLTSCAMAASAVGVVVVDLPFLADWFGATALVTTRIAVALVEWGATIPGASLGGVGLPWTGALVALVIAVVASRASSSASMCVRLVLGATLLVGCIAARRRDAAADSRLRAFVIPAGRASAIALANEGTLRILALDSATCARALSTAITLARSLSLEVAPALALDTSTMADAGRRTLALGEEGAMLRDAPVVLDRRARHAFRLARDGGIDQLVVDLDVRHERVYAFEHTSTWSPIRWH